MAQQHGRPGATGGDVEDGSHREGAARNELLPRERPVAAHPDRETIVVLDFGSQYSRLIARKVRECNVYCEIFPFDTPWEEIAPLRPKGFILSGGPASVYEPGAPQAPAYVFQHDVPVLGICYGMQLLAHQLGGRVAPGAKREYGHALLRRSVEVPLFHGLADALPVWMSHGDVVAELPPGFSALAFTENSPVAVMGNPQGIIGLQFHPEVAHTPQGKAILRNFLAHICGCRGDWTPGNFIAESVERIRAQVGDGRVICALSGGVDSAVAASLVHRAVGDQLTCIFVNNGLLRWGEAAQVVETFQRNLGFDLRVAEATDRFLGRLAGVVDPEQKRRIVGEEFIRVFEEEAGRLGPIDFLVQGTIYPDVIESAGGGRAAARIKTHHNVGGLPEDIAFGLIEPLRYLFKDEVRRMGEELGLPEEMLWRHPFPGPGMAIRILGEVTGERLAVARAADRIVLEEVRNAGLYRDMSQVFAVLTGGRSVGVQGDFRTYGETVAVRAVVTDDFMTADWA
ncbi:MAG: glutamine-hydrolyzing GMP synthase, partial [Chloroflexi bacterium]|nr:glutamine-hydrolyzing GMP synthase [Chloroflexota bacterium]